MGRGSRGGFESLGEAQDSRKEAGETEGTEARIGTRIQFMTVRIT